MNTPLSRLQHDLDLLDSLFIRWDARESIGTEIAHAIGVGSEYRFVRELMAAYRGCVAVPPSHADHIPDASKMVPPSQGMEIDPDRQYPCGCRFADGCSCEEPPKAQPHPDVTGLVEACQPFLLSWLQDGRGGAPDAGGVASDDYDRPITYGDIRRLRDQLATFQSRQEEGA